MSGTAAAGGPRLGVIGWPINHSRSPAMQTAGLRALGLDWEYAALAVAPDEIELFVQHGHQHGYRGVNVTIPHKEAAFRLSTPDELATRVGAVNTLVFVEGGGAKGYNTDVHGFTAWAAEVGAKLEGTAVILGAGGAARAVAVALHGHARAAVVARSPKHFIIDGHELTVTRWDDAMLPKLLARADLLIDATPRGLDPDAPELDLSSLPAHAFVLDLVVARETRLTAAAKARGLQAATGAPMLLHQGARALELWTDQPAPLEVMRKALDAAL